MTRSSPVLALVLMMVLEATAAAAGSVDRGPFVGHVTPHAASIWARCGEPGDYTLRVVTADGSGAWTAATTATATASPAADLTVVWTVAGLEPARRYRYRIERDGEVLVAGAPYVFATAPLDDEPATVTIALGSCAFEDIGTARIWRRLDTLDPDAIVLLGDTPYIDSTDLEVQRQRYRDFAAVVPMRVLFAGTSWYATWDDHDFGMNDADGTLPGKEHSRRAFGEYHANPSCGAGDAGVYTTFRRGPVQMFILDTRWFAATEPSPADPLKTTLLGAAQWSWLQRELRRSTAPFKVLASGIVWNGAVRPGKVDHWETYVHERDALFAYIGAQAISGVVLVSGDIHRSRVIRHDTAATAGYVLTELITSPMHDQIIGQANQPHPGLVWDSGIRNSALLLRADTTAAPATLWARFINAAGDVIFETTLTSGELVHGPQP